MNIHVIGGGMVGANSYLLTADKGSKGILIDAGCSISALKKEVEKHASGIAAVLLTHGHFDHITTLEKIKELYNPKVYIHKDDAKMLGDAHENMSDRFMRKVIAFDEADVLVKDGDELDIEGIKIKVIHTPGHSMGCVIYVIGDNAFTGDTLFKGSIGRFDFPHSNFEMLLNSLITIKKELPNNMKVYPGHGKSTTMAEEMAHNIHLQF